MASIGWVPSTPSIRPAEGEQRHRCFLGLGRTGNPLQSVEIHDLVPHSHEIFHELLVSVVGRIDLGHRAKLGIPRWRLSSLSRSFVYLRLVTIGMLFSGTANEFNYTERMAPSPFTYRLAQVQDLEQLRQVMQRAIEFLQRGFLSPAQIKASHCVMGIDTQLVRDQTYFIIEHGSDIAGCGGWSWRSTLYGGDDSVVMREPTPLDPARDAARIRAMYTDPAFARRGVGRMLLMLCEDAARTAGFSRVELMATLSGEPLYRACGYQPIEQVVSKPIEGERVPLILMGKILAG